MSQTDCAYCPNPRTGRSAGQLAHRDCPHYWEHLAISQSETIRSQGEHLRKLIRERRAAESQADGAYDMAEQYAREAGHDITRHEVLRYVEDYWRLRGSWEAHMATLEGFHWEVYRLITRLVIGEGSGQLAAENPVDLAHKIADWIRTASKGVSKGKGRDLFPRPIAPRPTKPVEAGEATLFGGAAC